MIIVSVHKNNVTICSVNELAGAQLTNSNGKTLSVHDMSQALQPRHINSSNSINFYEEFVHGNIIIKECILEGGGGGKNSNFCTIIPCQALVHMY